MMCLNLPRVVFLVVMFMDVPVTKGLITCHDCDSEHGPCRLDNMNGTSPLKCSRLFFQCSLYKRLFPNGTTAQVTRGCDRDCDTPIKKWTVHSQKTTHCKFCCDRDLCNTHLGDPCSGSSILMNSYTMRLLVLVSVGLCTS